MSRAFRRGLGRRSSTPQAHALPGALDGDPSGLRGRRRAVPRAQDLPFWLAVTLLEHGELTGRRVAPRRGARDLRAPRGDARGSSGSTPLRPRARRYLHDLRVAAATSTPRARSSAASAARRSQAVCGSCGTSNPPGQRFCGECGAAARSDRDLALAPAGTVDQARRGAPPRLAPVRSTSSGSRRHLRIATRRRRGSSSRVLRDRARRHRALWRDGREVHRRRGDGRLGHSDRDRRRCRARRPRCSRARRDACPSSTLPQQLAPACSRARPPSRSARRTRAWSPAISSTPPRASSPLPSREPSLSVTRRGVRADAAIAFEDAGEHELKGKAEPMRLWRALRVVANRGGEGRSSGLEAPFVGRDRELRLVKELFQASAEESRAHIVLVTGSAGIGKSRLSWEFEKYVDGLTLTTWWHKGRCPSYGEGVAYWALAEMVRGRAGILESEDAGLPRAKARCFGRRARSRCGRPRVGRTPAGTPARPRRRDLRAGRPLRGLATLLRISRRRAAGGPRVRGSSVGRCRPPRLHRVPRRVGTVEADLRARPRTAGARGAEARASEPRPAAASPASRSSRSPMRQWTPCSRGSCPAYRKS